jgi:esterase/lipase
MSENKFIHLFEKHYAKRFQSPEANTLQDINGIKEKIIIQSKEIREDNYPNILYHGHKTDHVIILVHGLTDSPYYMKDIAELFYSEGANVILPLLPGHGLNSADDAFKKLQDFGLDKQWKAEVDSAVEIAHMIGKNVSIGGLSTGGALSINKVLRDSHQITGGIFLFSAALSVGWINENIKKIPIIQPLVKIFENSVIFIKSKIGITVNEENPYKYSFFSNVGGLELVDIILENQQLLKQEGTTITQPIFAAHSDCDTTAKKKGIEDLLKHNFNANICGEREPFYIEEKENVGHANLVLKNDIPSINDPEETVYRNQLFDKMMNAAINFYKKHVLK